LPLMVYWALDDNMDGSRTAVKDEVGTRDCQMPMLLILHSEIPPMIFCFILILVQISTSHLWIMTILHPLFMWARKDPRVDTLVEQMDQIMETTMMTG
jgi:hypothetical protein